MESDRRKFIKIIGSSSLIYAAYGLMPGCTSSIKKSGGPYAGWKGPEKNIEDPRIWALSYAILAPNPHNRQPWTIELIGNNKIDIFIDKNRLLAATDPYNRQIVMGTGAFLEILKIAAAEKGFKTITEIMQNSSDNKIDTTKVFAQVTFINDKTVTADPLFKEILSRSTNRNPHDTRKSLPTDLKEKLILIQNKKININYTSDISDITKMTDLSLRAMEKELRTYNAFKESVDLFRIGESEIEKNPDGLPIRGFMIETLNSMGLLDRASMLDQKSSNFAKGLDTTLTPLKKSAAFLWITTESNSRRDQVTAGAAYCRSQLFLNSLGITCHPVSQALQEYSEMNDLYLESRKLMLVNKNQTLQMWARVGYAEPTQKSARWPLNSFIKKNTNI